MKNDDVELIQRSLTGDENAFAKLVRKYQKPVHALVWRGAISTSLKRLRRIPF